MGIDHPSRRLAGQHFFLFFNLQEQHTAMATSLGAVLYNHAITRGNGGVDNLLHVYDSGHVETKYYSQFNSCSFYWLYIVV